MTIHYTVLTNLPKEKIAGHMHLFFGLCHLTTLIYRLNITHAWKHLDLTHANMDPIPFFTLYFTTGSPCNPQIAGVRAVYHHTGHGYFLIKYIFRASNMTQKVKVPAPKLYKLRFDPWIHMVEEEN